MKYITHKLLCQLFRDDTSLYYTNMPSQNEYLAHTNRDEFYCDGLRNFCWLRGIQILCLNAAKRIWEQWSVHCNKKHDDISGFVSLIRPGPLPWPPKPRNKPTDSVRLIKQAMRYSRSYRFNNHHSYLTYYGTNTQHFTQFATKDVKCHRL